MLRKLIVAIPVFFAVLFAQENNPSNDNEASTTAMTNVSNNEVSTKVDNNSEKISELEGKLAGIEESYLGTKAKVSKLAKLKISGYVQAQWQHAETLGVTTSKSGSKFDEGTDNKFFVRRGRLKFKYDNGLSQYCLQFDATSSGVSVKDAWASFKDPWLKYFSATMGIFDRPFGYELSYSSSMRESPERSRIYQTLFPKELEIGAQLAFAANKGILSYFNLKGGIFNGVTPYQLENDDHKDFIGRAGFEIPLRNVGMGIDGGFSTYLGKVTNTDTTSSGSLKGISYEMDGKVFKMSTGQKGKDFDRHYFGFDLQYYLDIPVIGGLTLRGEHLWGVQPGTSSSSSFYQPSSGGTPNGAVYSRNFSGSYLYWVQCWGTKVQSVVKFDHYDPNVDVEEDDIGVNGSGTGKSDLSYKTYGVGLIYNWDANVKLMAYYDVPRNEKSSSLGGKYAHDFKDNVFTLRVQYKF